MATLDTLELKIEANANIANKALDALVNKLTTLQTALGGLQTASLSNLANGVNVLSSSMQNFKASGVNKADFNRVTSGLKVITTVNPTDLYVVSSAVNSLGTAFTQLQTIAQSSQSIMDLIKTLRSLGGVSVARATSQIPPLTTALMNMFKELSKAPKVSQNIIDMTNALARLTANGSKVGTSARSMSKGFDKYSTSVKTAKKHTLSLAAAFGKFYATYFLVIRGIKGLWQGVQGAMNYIETFNYFNTTMDKVAQEYNAKYYDIGKEGAKSFEEGYLSNIKRLNEQMTGYTLGASGELVSSNMQSLGMDANQLMNFQARIGAVTNSMGLMGSTTSNTAEAFSMLSTDISSFTNTDLSSVFNDLNSGLLGQSRALYKYGIDITNTKLQEYAWANGITKKVSAMNQSEKAQLRILAILDQSKIAWGDQIKTMNSTANQYRMLQQGIKNLGRILGQLLLPAVKMALPVVNGLVMALSDLFEILGFKVWGDDWLKGLMEDANGGYKATEDLADGFGDIEDGINDANVDAKKLKKTLQGFDELNVLSSKDNDTSNALGVSFDLSNQIDDALSEYRKKWDDAFKDLDSDANTWKNRISEKLGKIKILFEDLEAGDLEKFGQDLSSIVIDLNNAFANAIDNVEWEELGRKAGELFNGIDWVGIFKSGFNLMDTIFRSACEAFSGFAEESPFGALLVGGIVTLLGMSKYWQQSGLLVALDGAMGKAIKGLSLSNFASALIASIVVADFGFNLGKAIGKALNEDDAFWYDTFSFTGENGLFDSMEWAFSDALKKMGKAWDDFKDYVAGASGSKEMVRQFNQVGKTNNPNAKYISPTYERNRDPWIKEDSDMAMALLYSKGFDFDAVLDNKNLENIDKNSDRQINILEQMLVAIENNNSNREISSRDFNMMQQMAIQYQNRTGKPAFGR